MVCFVFIAQTFQNLNSFFFGRFTDCYRLKTPFKCGIFFNIFTVFIYRSSTDNLNFTTGKRRF